ncbi:hypothetical protein JL09_g6575 [Pichia kudriavzevii]|uniref:Uncharacterized protein n=1 Tax=Pichia kudriavzevii TaxID=4909 RepID=A0A099NN99_PICKU|nr:hypothetical protein JL09_g6575 [Pichia kudriavzevii]
MVPLRETKWAIEKQNFALTVSILHRPCRNDCIYTTQTMNDCIDTTQTM